MEWNRGRVIGRGSSATVSIAKSATTGEIFAVKSAELSQSEPLQRETKILSSLKSPHVVTYIGHNITQDHNSKPIYNLLMEYIPGGTVSDAVLQHKGLDEPTIRRYAKKIVQGLDYLHSLGLVHCDIKGRNILLAEDGPKIADFGCAKATDIGGGNISGTPMFMSPEAARGEEQGPASDIWSLGCTVIEMSGFSPWPDFGDYVGVLYRIAWSNDLPEFPGFLSPQAKDFLGKCLRRNRGERWTACELLKHPFLVESECSSSSPTTVLDHRLWSFVAEEEANSEISFDADFAVERIQRLAMGSGELGFSVSDDQDWITVRSSAECSVDNYGSTRSCDYLASISFYHENSIDIVKVPDCTPGKNVVLSENLVFDRQGKMSLSPLISRFSNY